MLNISRVILKEAGAGSTAHRSLFGWFLALFPALLIPAFRATAVKMREVWRSEFPEGYEDKEGFHFASGPRCGRTDASPQQLADGAEAHKGTVTFA